MARIKFTGYIDVSDLEEDQINLADPSGLSRQGMDDYTGPGSLMQINELEALSVELEA